MTQANVLADHRVADFVRAGAVRPFLLALTLEAFPLPDHLCPLVVFTDIESDRVAIRAIFSSAS